MDSASRSRSGKSTADARGGRNAAGADGLVLLDKPEGLSSFRCLSPLKRVLGTRRVGHIGTLDPFASGLVGAVTGRATRLARLLSGLEKRYRVTIRFGCETDTLDPEGSVVGSAPVPALERVRRVLPGLVGRMPQRPPAYSAVQVDGRRAYSLARRGQRLQLPAREVTVAAVELVDWRAPELTLEMTCSAGTYVRSWARDLGVAAASRAYAVRLRRLTIGPFSICEAAPPDTFRRDRLLPPAEFLSRLPHVACVTVRAPFRRHLVCGRPVTEAFFASDPVPGADYYAAFDADRHLLALLRWCPDTGPDPHSGGRATSRDGRHHGWSYAGVFVDR